MLTKTLSEAKKKQRNILIKAMNNDIGSIDSVKDSWNPAQISERAKDISYIRSLVDTWNPAQLNEALQMLDLPVIDTWNPAQIEEQRRNLVFYLAERTLTGNPITLNILGNLTPEVTSLKVTMNPIQSGTGDPSPTNIRPISGRTEVSVTRTAGEDVETKTTEFKNTVYGASLDSQNGSMDITKKAIRFGDMEWTYHSAGGLYSAYFDTYLPEDSIIGQGYVAADIITERYKSVPSASIATEGYDDGVMALANGTRRFIVCDKNFTDADTFKATLEDVIVVYSLATTDTVETTPEGITLLKGTNVLSTDGDSIELKYKQNF